MKSLKMLGLMVVAAAAFMVVAASASATELTSPKNTTYEGEITATSEGHAVLKGSFGVEVKCDSHTAGNIEESGGAEVAGAIEELSFTGCTDEYAAHVLNNGSLSINGSGVVRGYGNEVQVTTPLGINCTYKTNATTGTVLGNLTDSDETGSTATLDISATIPRTGGSFLCGSTGAWSGSYSVSAPDALYVD